ncbi:hypothetical protein SCLCIDRAFT_34613 [Scleroderma citrinum Foug A]|uniref:Uncharacterized protein n=1 Tax=Scleroderma citrinum Foug A TaxID=1036808 RepID=A0A0C3D168_9AGAM|nr:hypothetical protein SCLCIDRAFT_34613 [Scleroderma citrinum Foug A]
MAMAPTCPPRPDHNCRHLMTLYRHTTWFPRFASSAITIIFVSAAITIASHLTPNARRSCLLCTLNLSKDDPSTWDLDRHISRLGLLDFALIG